MAAYGDDGTPIAETDAEQILLVIPDDLTGGRPWIDSCVASNVTAGTKTSPAEDFYTDVNEDKIVSTKIPDRSYSLDKDNFTESRSCVQLALMGKDIRSSVQKPCVGYRRKMRYDQKSC